MKQITTFFMFVGDKHGKAAEAIEFYISLFPDSRIDAMERYGAGEREPEGTVKVATFTMKGRKYMAMDSAAPHPFTFTPAISLFIECETTKELERLYHALSANGQVLMPLDNYGFSPAFGWVNDRFGVSWQLNLVTGGQ